MGDEAVREPSQAPGDGADDEVREVQDLLPHAGGRHSLQDLQCHPRQSFRHPLARGRTQAPWIQVLTAGLCRGYSYLQQH